MAFRKLNGCHVIAAYILVETEAGKAAAVAAALRDLPGVPETAVLAGPYDVIARAQAPSAGTGPAGHLPDPGPRWRATDDGLPGRPPLKNRSAVEHHIAICEAGEGGAQAVCTCGWCSPAFGAGKTAGTMDSLQRAADAGDLHEWEMSPALTGAAPSS